MRVAGHRVAVLAAVLCGVAACSGGTTSTGSSGSSEVEVSTGRSSDVLDLPEVGVETVTTALAVPREVITIDDDTVLISGQEGVVLVLTDGEVRDEPFLDLTADLEQPTGQQLERGLLGLALDPGFADNGRVYTLGTYPAADGARGQTSTLARWTAGPATLTVDPASEEVLVEVPRSSVDHSGGEIVFDSEGMLVTALGVDSPEADLAQDPAELVGTVLRLDVSGQEGYAVPEDNPHGAAAERDDGWAPEVYATGYRNPWRVAWDPALGVLVGVAMSRDGEQQVHLPEAGDNAGYPGLPYSCWEDGVAVTGCTEGPDGAALTPPAASYPGQQGRILSGVVPVRDSGIPELEGSILVSDWNGSLFAATPGEPPWVMREVELGESFLPVGGYLWDLDRDEQGALYLMVTSRSLDEGSVLRLTTG